MLQHSCRVLSADLLGVGRSPRKLLGFPKQLAPKFSGTECSICLLTPFLKPCELKNCQTDYYLWNDRK